MFEAVVNKIAAYPRVILHRHSRPDGDNVPADCIVAFCAVGNLPIIDIRIFVIFD